MTKNEALLLLASIFISYAVFLTLAVYGWIGLTRKTFDGARRRLNKFDRLVLAIFVCTLLIVAVYFFWVAIRYGLIGG